MGRTMLTSWHHLPLLLAGCALPTIAAAQVEPRPVPASPTGTSQANDPAKVSNNDASSDAAAATAAGSTKPAEGPAQASESVLGDIIVTAQRREERLQDVPAAISAIGTQQLASAGIVNTRDLQLVTPSISFTQASYAPQPAIRGIGTRGTNPGDEQVVPVYLDGVYQPFILGGIFELSDVERIEVLRGPQGTLLGRNATGGAINIITQTPKPGFGGKLTLGYGRFNERQVDAYVTGGDDVVAGSLNVQYLEDDGYVRDIINNRTLAKIDSLFVRAKVQITPTDRTTITAAISRANRYDDTSLANFALNGSTIARAGRPGLVYATGNLQTSQDLGFKPSLRTRQDALSATVVQQFDRFDVTSITGYSESVLTFDADADMTPAPVINLKSRQFDRSLTEDLFAASTGDGPFQWVGGVFFFSNKAGQNPRNLNGGLIFTDTRATAYAAYAQGTYDLTRLLHVTVGGRYSYDKKSAQARNGTNTQILPFQERSWDSFNPSASIDYEFARNSRVYARYATAFKSGVFNATGFAARPVTPEQVKSYEIGVKSDPMPWLRVNVAAFYTDYDNIQIFARSADPTNASVVLENAATAKIKGAEGDITARLFDGFTMRAGASYLDAKYDSFPRASSLVNRADGAGNAAVVIDASGNRLSRVPEFTANIGGDYRFDLAGGSLVGGANLYYNDGFNWSVDDRLRQDAYILVNGQVSWTSPQERFTLTIWGRNLTDSKPLLTLSSSVLGDQAAYYRPVSYGVRLTTRF